MAVTVTLVPGGYEKGYELPSGDKTVPRGLVAVLPPAAGERVTVRVCVPVYGPTPDSGFWPEAGARSASRSAPESAIAASASSAILSV